MHLAVMQPYFMPYIGYFSLIKQVDIFVLLDTVQFINRGWIERNRILKPTSSWQYIAVPLKKHSQKTPINQIYIREEPWREKMLAQLVHYKRKAPFYNQTITLLEGVLNRKYNMIAQLNQVALEACCNYLGWHKTFQLLSNMHLEIKEPQEPDEWGLYICQALKADHYYNLSGGQKIYNREKYRDAGVALHFVESNLPLYPQGGRNFEAGLSILDVMMWNSPEEINKMIDDCKIF